METAGHLARALIGVAALLAIAYALSANRRKIDWRLVAGGLGLQLAIAALLLLDTPGVTEVFDGMANFFVILLSFAGEGAAFVFGALGDPAAVGEVFGADRGFVFAFHALPNIIFFSALSSLLYYLGVLQFIVKGIAWVMSRAMRLSGAESLATAANVFIGQTEAPLVIKPYIPTLTRSELTALMVGGMATIAGSVFAIYVGFLGGDSIEEKQAFAKVLLCASLMNAPAALLIAKILVPETGKVNRNLNVSRDRLGSNLIDAIANGTTEGLKLALNVAAMLIAFLALIAMFNFILGSWFGRIPLPGHLEDINAWIAHASGGTFEALSLQAICGFVFAPIAWLVGIAWDEILQVGQLVGMKVIANEFVAFENLGAMKAAGDLSARSVFISTFALCGFANFSSIGIQIGGIGALAPERRGDLASLGLKALAGGTLASLLSASIAGIFFSAG